MFKKALSLLLSLMLIVTSLSVTALSVSAADDVTYVVAGVDALCDVAWKGDTTEGADNIMTQNADGTYTMTYADVAVMNDYQFKVVANDAEGNMTWYGIDGGDDNVTFHVVEACDVTITFDPSTLKITVEGDGVEIPTGLNIESMRTVGNGEEGSSWLNGVTWGVDNDANLMTETSTGVYEITYEDVEEFDNYEIKFAANGSWAVNWGGVYAGSGVETDAVFNGSSNITVDVPYEFADVTVKLDLTGFDYATKTGAKFTITVTDASEPVPTEPAPTEEVPTEPAPTEPAPTEPVPTEPAPTEPVAEGLTVTATSNLFPAYTQKLGADETQVTVTYMIDCAKDMLNTQWAITYDPEKLAFNRSANLNSTGRGWNFMPQVATGGVYNPNPDSAPDKILGNATDLALYVLSNNGPVPFVTVTFDVIGSGETTVDLFVDVLTVSELGDDFQTDTSKEEAICDYGQIKDYSCALDVDTFVYEGTFNPAPTHPVTDPVTEPATTEPVPTEPATTEPVPTEPATTEPVPTEPVPTEPVPTDPTPADSTYIVAGSEDLTGANWDGSAAENTMTLVDGLYTLTFPAAQPTEGNPYQIKVVEHPAEGEAIWHGDATGNNITFNVLSECDVTVTIDPVTKEITVTGAGVEMVTELQIDTMRTVGNGEEGSAWLNGVTWGVDNDANLMTEITDGVYTITYEDVDAFDNYEVKFAANGSWTDNWGGVYAGSGVETDAEYNSASNITVDVPYELADVTITLDLTNFNYATKTGAKFTITVEDASEVPTEPVPTEPVPTEEVPTEPAPTEPVPTEPVPTEPVPTEPVPTDPTPADSTYIVAGSEDLTGANWDGSAAENTMTLVDGLYTLTFPAAQPTEGNPYQIKVVEHPAEGEAIWHGDATGNNITFNVLSECDVTVTIDPVTKEITVTGAGVEMVTELQIDTMRTVGNGEEGSAWLNGVTWGVDNDANLMTEVADKVYTITYEDVEMFSNYEVKFAANGSWTDNWGGVYVGSGVETDAEYNSNSNITVDVPYELADVTITLDLTNFNYASKTGAKFTITVEEATVPPVPTEPVPTEPVPTDPVPEDTLKVTSTSNFFGTDEKTVEYNADNTVTVTYYLQSEKDLMNAQWILSYDNALLELVSAAMPNTADGSMINDTVAGQIEGSCSNINLYDFSTSKAFVEVTFKTLGTGETNVHLEVTDLNVSEPKADGTSDETKEVVVVKNADVITTEGIVTDTVITEGVVPTEPVPTEPVPTEPVPTEPTPTEPTPTEPTPTEPVPTEPTPTEPVPTEPTPTEPAETDPTTPDVTPTVPGESTDATSATGATTDGTSTSDTPSGGSNNGTVQTGNASMALVILLVLVSASAVLYFTRKRVR